MGTDIYNSRLSFGGAFSLDEATLTFSGLPGSDGGLGFLIQSVGIQYARPVQRIFELGPRKTTYYVVGRAEGRMAINRLAAPAPVNTAFLTQFADVCNVQNNTFSIDARPSTRCSTGLINVANTQDARYKFHYCIVDNVSFQMSVQAIALTENLSLMFAAMELDDSSTGSINR